MWWSGLPGFDAPATTGRTLADRAAAVACADRISPLDPTEGGLGSQTYRLAEDFLDWLAEAEDGASAQARRLALCMTCTHVTANTTRGDVFRTAKWLYETLTA
jgi:hypothetical protein